MLLEDGTYARKQAPVAKHLPPRLPWLALELSRSERVIVFCEPFRITSGPDAGKLFVMREWQRDFIRDVYRDVDGVRPVRTAILSMGRQNGKTALAALMALCHTVGPEASAARCPSLRASLCFHYQWH